jgi:UDP-glucose 4-epimerase
MRWLITGGCGFIGLNLVQSLVGEAGHYIRIVDNLSAGNRQGLSETCTYTEMDPNSYQNQHSKLNKDKNLSTNHESEDTLVELIVGDILDADLALKLARDMDVVVHLAANSGVAPSVKNPRADCQTNVMGTLNYLEASRQNSVARFVFASSGAPLGDCEPPLHEELAPHPVSPYGASKLAGEGYCSAYCKTYGLDTVCLRFGNVYGPLSNHKSSVVAKFIKSGIQGEILEIYGHGNQSRDFIYVEDLVQAIRQAAAVKNIGGQTFQIATSHEVTVNELVEKLTPIFAQANIKQIEVVNTEARMGDVLRNFSDTSKAKKILRWQASTSLEEGLVRTFNWFQEKGAL